MPDVESSSIHSSEALMIIERAAAEGDLHRQVAEFLASEFSRDGHKSAVKLQLGSSDAGRENPIEEWDREETPKLFTHGAILELTQIIVNHAIAYVDGMGIAAPRDGVRFVLRCVQVLGARKTRNFIVRPTAELSGTGSLDASAQGMLAMQMRHNERMFEQNNALMTGTTGVLLDQITRLQTDGAKKDARIEALVAENSKLKESDDARMMEALNDERANERKDKLVGQIMQFMPIALARLATKDGAPGSAPTPLALMVVELAKTLEPHQMMQIMGALTMAQRAMFAQIMQMASSTAADPQRHTPETSA